MATCVGLVARMRGLGLALREQLRAPWRMMVRGTDKAHGLVVVRLVLPRWTLLAVRHQALDQLVRVIRVLGEFDASHGAWGTLLHTVCGSSTRGTAGDVMVWAFAALQLARRIGESAQGTGQALVGRELVEHATGTFHWQGPRENKERNR